MDSSKSKPARSGHCSSKLIAAPVAVALAMLFGSGAAHAVNTGTDTDLSFKPASGGLGGAAFTRPQEASAAVFGNPATITQFTGTQFGIGAGFLVPKVDVQQDGAAGSHTSSSAAKNYVVPDTAATHEVGNGWFLGGGIELSAGLGADYRNDPITIPSLSADPKITGLPLVVELISFNANVALAKQLTPQTSVGAAVTIGFGLAQLGTSGPSGTFAGLFPQFGGTTSSVHEVAFGASLGATHQLTPSTMLSASLKSPLKYKFSNILNQSAVAPAGYQDLTVEQPLQITAGAAFDIAPGWLVEGDVLWKNWSNADTYKDVYKDQFLFLLGTQYKTGPWSLRLGYSYAGKILRDTPSNTLGGLNGLGPVPLGAASGPLGVDVVKLVQMTLLPVIWQNTLSGGVGFDLTPKVRLDAFGSYAFKESATRTTHIGAAIVPGAGPETYRTEASAWLIGAGLSFKY